MDKDMTNDNLTKWRSLLSQLDLCLESFGNPIYPHRVSTLNEAELEDFASQEGLIWPKGSLSTLTEDQIQKFESQAGLILPEGYREFCQVFGSEKFGKDGFFIDVPDIDDIEGHLDENESLLDSCKDSSLWSSEVKELLDNSYLFGGGCGLVACIFDLRTYREQDRSYDIYGVNCNHDFTCHLGRDFFEFVRDICIGERAKAEFPELLLGGQLDIDENNLFYRRTTFLLDRNPSSIRADPDIEEGDYEEYEEEEEEEDYWLT
ncbi:MULTISPECIES: SMI1/KNR4 family protein [unclassified Microcoleus]|uniref:SMI1/KNR4 family protein n=1 Tax=unclassified Microcoleus TaxID=2642155 RepID=UPI002FD4209C